MSDAHSHVFVYGRVQGVGYRAWAAAEAQARELAGFVRNRRDGSVEALLVGAQADVAAMIEALRRGPPAARVEAIDERETATDTLKLASRPFAMLPTL